MGLLKPKFLKVKPKFPKIALGVIQKSDLLAPQNCNFSCFSRGQGPGVGAQGADAGGCGGQSPLTTTPGALRPNKALKGLKMALKWPFNGRLRSLLKACCVLESLRASSKGPLKARVFRAFRVFSCFSCFSCFFEFFVFFVFFVFLCFSCSRKSQGLLGASQASEEGNPSASLEALGFPPAAACKLPPI